MTRSGPPNSSSVPSRSSARSAKALRRRIHSVAMLRRPPPPTGKGTWIGKYSEQDQAALTAVARRSGASGELTAGDLERRGQSFAGAEDGREEIEEEQIGVGAVRSPPLRCDDSLTQQERWSEARLRTVNGASVRPAATTSVLHPPSGTTTATGPYIDSAVVSEVSRPDRRAYVIRAHGGPGAAAAISTTARARHSSSTELETHLPSAILRSATRLRVFILRFKKPKSPPNDEKRTAKFLFSSSRSSARSAKLYAEESIQSPASSTSSSDGKRNVAVLEPRSSRSTRPSRVERRVPCTICRRFGRGEGNHSLGLRSGRGDRRKADESAR
ncbi:uncharacterized protein A4U43_C01F4010 [Asparagus officinalis]|uniref:Uncharacterized protein n=1 Tax=Asparagus officinalis TaxID=4686 RepID=A0A5P1FP51_ASPOF|nr:uncharacterized protein A4U43_C01F4010 [Asparagus officinalis]